MVVTATTVSSNGEKSFDSGLSSEGGTLNRSLCSAFSYCSTTANIEIKRGRLGPAHHRQWVVLWPGLPHQDRREHARSAGQLAQLEDGLVRSLKAINSDMLSEKALVLWRDLWQELGSPHLKLELPLRIFRVGIAYLSQPDDRVLLDLIATERRILQQALGLEPADFNAR